jgi:hypothetical protein
MKLIQYLFIVFILASLRLAHAVDLSSPATPPPEPTEQKTSSDILSPLLSFFSNYKGFQLPAHSSQCYTPRLAVMSKTIVMDWHCVQLEKHRLLFSLIFLTSWALTAFTIIMSA